MALRRPSASTSSPITAGQSTPSLEAEARTLAQDLLDEWECSGGVKYWTDEEKRSFIKRAADLSAYVLEIVPEEKP